MKISNIIRGIVCILLFTILIKIIGLEKIINTFKQINLLYLIPSILIFIISLLIGVINIKIFTDKIKRISIFKLTKYYMISWALGTISPGRIGEFSIIMMLRNHGIKMGESFAISIIDKILTIISLMICTIILAYILLQKTIFINIVIFSITLIILGIISWLFNKHIREFIKRYILKKYSYMFTGFYKTILFFLKNNKVIFANFIITIIKWYISAIILLLLFKCFNISPNLNMIFLIFSATTFIALIPISISGLGVKESAAVYLFNIIGINPEITISVYLILNILAYSLSFSILSFSEEGIKTINNLKNNIK